MIQSRFKPKKSPSRKTRALMSGTSNRKGLGRKKIIVRQPQSASHARRGSVGTFVQSGKRLKYRKFSVHQLSSIIKSFAHQTRQGFIPENQEKVNQDSYIEVLNLGGVPETHLFGVCDGHGQFGREVSSYVKQRLPVLISQSLSLGFNARKALTTSILRCNEELLGINVDVSFSGTTLVVALFQGKSLFCANVGDSRAVLARQMPDKLGESRHWMAISLSRDHKPDIPDEYARIIKANGRVEAYADENGDDVGPARVWLIDKDFPGLAMSRSLGDTVAASVGVFAQPEILKFDLTVHDKFLVLASDGVFEFIGNEEAVKIVIPNWKGNDPQSAAKELENESVKRWKANEDVIDDITSICIFLDI